MPADVTDTASRIAEKQRRAGLYDEKGTSSGAGSASLNQKNWEACESGKVTLLPFEWDRRRTTARASDELRIEIVRKVLGEDYCSDVSEQRPMESFDAGALVALLFEGSRGNTPLRLLSPPSASENGASVVGSWSPNTATIQGFRQFVVGFALRIAQRYSIVPSALAMLVAPKSLNDSFLSARTSARKDAAASVGALNCASPQRRSFSTPSGVTVVMEGEAHGRSSKVTPSLAAKMKEIPFVLSLEDAAWLCRVGCSQELALADGGRLLLHLTDGQSAVAISSESATTLTNEDAGRPLSQGGAKFTPMTHFYQIAQKLRLRTALTSSAALALHRAWLLSTLETNGQGQCGGQGIAQKHSHCAFSTSDVDYAVEALACWCGILDVDVETKAAPCSRHTKSPFTRWHKLAALVQYPFRELSQVEGRRWEGKKITKRGTVVGDGGRNQKVDARPSMRPARFSRDDAEMLIALLLSLVMHYRWHFRVVHVCRGQCRGGEVRIGGDFNGDDECTHSYKTCKRAAHGALRGVLWALRGHYSEIKVVGWLADRRLWAEAVDVLEYHYLGSSSLALEMRVRALLVAQGHQENIFEEYSCAESVVNATVNEGGGNSAVARGLLEILRAHFNTIAIDSGLRDGRRLLAVAAVVREDSVENAPNSGRDNDCGDSAVMALRIVFFTWQRLQLPLIPLQEVLLDCITEQKGGGGRAAASPIIFHHLCTGKMDESKATKQEWAPTPRAISVARLLIRLAHLDLLIPTFSWMLHFPLMCIIAGEYRE